MTDEKHRTTEEAGPAPPADDEERRLGEAVEDAANGIGDGAEGSSVRASDEPAADGQEAGVAEAELDPLREAERQRDEYLELAQRTQAEFENYRKRMNTELAAAAERGKGELASGLVGVLDNLERALEAVEVEPEAALNGAEVEGALEQGVVLTYRELRGTLSRAGVEGIDPAGDRFDPTWHEAIQSLPSPEHESGVVVEVLQKGYRLGDRVLRPARVIVSA